MAVGRVSGYPDLTFDGSKYIPVLFAPKVLQKFYSKTSLEKISHTDYVGEIKNVGDRVTIRTVPDMVIRPYKKGQTTDLDFPSSEPVTFTVDYADYFNSAFDDIDIKQMDLNMMEACMEDASQKMKIIIERRVFGTIYADADSDNSGSTAGKISGNIDLGTTGSPVTLTKTNVIDKIVECNQVLDEQDIPEEDRWIVIPAWMSKLLKTSDLKDASITGDTTGVIRNGRLGMIDNFTVYKSNLLTTVTDGGNNCTYILFGHKSSLAFVSQITKTEVYRPPNTFADAVKGLIVYGFKVLQPTALGVLYATS